MDKRFPIIQGEKECWRKDRMKRKRLERKMNQTTLGKKTGLAATTICSYEAGYRIPTIMNLKKICTALKVSADYLMGIRPQDIRSKGE